MAEEQLNAGPVLLPDFRSEQPPGLKVPCHNTDRATAAQLRLLRRVYGSAVPGFGDCCGLSGSARFIHPRIGTEVAAELFRSVAREPVTRLVSGCPACRDGAEMQRLILAEEQGPGGAVPREATSDLFSVLLPFDLR